MASSTSPPSSFDFNSSSNPIVSGLSENETTCALALLNGRVTQELEMVISLLSDQKPNPITASCVNFLTDSVEQMKKMATLIAATRRIESRRDLECLEVSNIVEEVVIGDTNNPDMFSLTKTSTNRKDYTFAKKSSLQRE